MTGKVNMLVVILMSTYNGEKYLANQIYSLMQQSHKYWQLFIRDDGSTDSTIDIINKFIALDKRINLVSDTLGNLGAGKSFWALLRYSNSEYTMFCDQDDIWFEKKIELMLKFSEEKFDKNIPCLSYSNAHPYSDEEGVVLSNSMLHLHAKELKDFIFLNGGYHGCCLMFNNKLLKLAQEYKKVFFLHDDIICLLAYTFGKVYYLPKSLMLYRQHAKNVTAHVRLNKFEIIKQFFDRDACVVNHAHYQEKVNFYNNYKELINNNVQKFFTNFFLYVNVGFATRLWLVFRNKFTNAGSIGVLLLKTLIRKPLGNFKK